MKWSTLVAHALCFLPGALAPGSALAALPVEQVDGRLGVAVMLNGQEELSAEHLPDASFALMSVMKFPLALTVLHQVEQGRLRLEQKLTLEASRLDPDTWSPMLRKFPEGGTFTIAELLRFCVAESDNNACNILFSLVGGAPAIQSFLEAHPGAGQGITIVCSEEAFRDRRMMRANHATPRAICRLLRELHLAAFAPQPPSHPLLERETARWLWNLMASSTTGSDCLRAGLPPEALLAHKTGSSGSENGVTLALNDAGIILLPDGRFACVAAFVGESRDSREKMAAALAEVARESVSLLLHAEQPHAR